MFTKKNFIVTFIVIFLNLISINSYADNFTSVMKQVRAKFKAEGYPADDVKQMTRANTSVSNNLRQYLKLSCLAYEKYNYIPAISGYGGSSSTTIENITLNAKR